MLWEQIVRTWEREEPISSSPWQETMAKTIWTSQLKTPPQIATNQAFIYTPYGSLAVISGRGLTDGLVLSRQEDSGVSLTDQNGTKARRVYIWRDDFIVAHFYEDPESVTVKTQFDEAVIPLTRFPAQ